MPGTISTGISLSLSCWRRGAPEFNRARPLPAPPGSRTGALAVPSPQLRARAQRTGRGLQIRVSLAQQRLLPDANCSLMYANHCCMPARSAHRVPGRRHRAGAERLLCLSLSPSPSPRLRCAPTALSSAAAIPLPRPGAAAGDS